MKAEHNYVVENGVAPAREASRSALSPQAHSLNPALVKGYSGDL